MALSIPNNDFCVDSQYDFYQHITLTDEGALVVSLGATYNPALTPIYDYLIDISENTDGILLDTNQLVINTDDNATETTLSSLLTSFNLEDFASETTLGEILTKLGEIDGNTDTIEALLGDIISNTLDVSTETTLASLLTSFDNTDFATELTLSNILIDTGDIDITLSSLLTDFNATDFASETTLVGIKDQTDLLTFDGNKLETTATITGTVSVVAPSPIGNTAIEIQISDSTTSQLISASDVDRKQVIIINNSSKDVWLRYVSPAIKDEGIKLKKNDIWVEDNYSGDIYGVWKDNANGELRVTEIK